MKKLEDKALFYKAMGEPGRLRIIDFLLDKDCVCICELARLIGKDQSVAFRHIKLLEKAGIVRTGKEAKFLMCCIRDKRRMKRYMEG